MWWKAGELLRYGNASGGVLTTLVCWTGCDSRGPSSLYVATDSRYSWNSKTWSSGRKLIVRAQLCEIVAFAGDCAFAASVLLGLPEHPLSDNLIHRRLTTAATHYPFLLENTVIVFARRLGQGMRSSFLVTTFENRSGVWIQNPQYVSREASDVVCAVGSGASLARDEVKQWMEGDVSGRTSRSVFSGFCSALDQAVDPNSGGAPQLASLYRSGLANECGLIWKGMRYVAGLPPDEDADLRHRAWHNELFERCDPHTMARLESAQRHVSPFRKCGTR